MKTILTLDKANVAYGFPQLDGNADLVINYISATTISATTYLGLPIDVTVTGGTYSGGTIVFIDNTGGTFSVSGFSTGTSFTGGTVSGSTTFTSGITATTISATTYQGLPSYIRRNALNSTNSNIDYCGYALFGSAESSTVWTINRITITSSGTTSTASATNVAWTNRESVTYT